MNKTKVISSSAVFHFLRGALRGTYGVENLLDRHFLIVGVSRVAQELLSCLCIEGINIFFQDSSIENYYHNFTICQDVNVYRGQDVDVIIDLEGGFITVGSKAFPIAEIGEDPYTQGIHEFYL